MIKFSQFLAEEQNPTDADLKDIEKGDKPNPNKKIVFVPYDANYFRTGDKKKDCVIRAISIAAMLGYKTVTELFNKKFIFGVGYASNSGISLEEVDEFADKTGIIEMIWGDKYHSMALDLFDDSTKYDTLQGFVNYLIDDLIELNDLKYKRFVIEVRDHDTKEGDEHHYHMTPLMFVKGKWQCWDLDSVKNIWESIPIRCYAVKKLFNENDEEYYTNEWKRIRKEQRRLLMRRKS